MDIDAPEVESDGDFEGSSDNVVGEAMLAEIPFSDLLGTGTIRVTQEKKRAAAKLAKRIETALGAFLDKRAPAESVPPIPPGFAYWDVYEALEHSFEELGLEQRMRGIDQDVDLSAAFKLAATNAWAYLQSVMPRRSKTGPLGPVALQPNDLDVLRFRRRFQVVEDPMRLLEDLQAERLSRQAIGTMTEVYPALYTFMRRVLVRLMWERRDADPKWTPSPGQARWIQRFLGTSHTNPRVLQDIAAVYEREKAAQPPPKPSSAKAQTTTMAQHQTPAQRVGR